MVDEEVIYKGVGQSIETIRQNLIKLIVVFLITTLLTILSLRVYLFETIQTQVLRFARKQGYKITISYINPFEIILLQAKIGIIVGIITTVPIFSYYLLRKKDILKSKLKNRKILTIIGTALILFIIGIYYAYFFMVPFFIQFASFLAIEAGIKPFFRITSFINFVLLYSIFLGVLTQIPLIMVILVRTNIVTYQFIREKWRYFIVISAVLAAIATPPDPITQATVLGPMILIYLIGILAVRIFAKKQIEQQKQQKEQKTIKKESEEKKISKENPPGKSAEKKESEETNIKQSQLEKSIQNIKENDLIKDEYIKLVKSLEQELSKRKKRLLLIFTATTAATFWWLVFYGIERIIGHTKSRLPQDITNQVSSVQLTVFELLFLITKYSLLIGLIAIIIPVLYYCYSVLSKNQILETSKIKYTIYIISIFFLFIIGSIFAYIFTIPVLIDILSRSIVQGQMNATYSITKLINFVIIVCITVGIIAEMPAAMYFLVKTKITKYKTLKEKWKHAILSSIVIGALITGPDPFTALAIAIPLSIFYIISLITTRILCHSTIKTTRKKQKEKTTAPD